jgi:recombination protein RecA
VGKATSTTPKEPTPPASAAGTPKQNSSKKEKFKALDAVKTQLDAQFKTTQSLTRYTAKAKRDVPCTPTGIYSIDNTVLGCGGLPDGRIIEVYGPESAGKTTIALLFIAGEQALGNLAAFVDAEHALDPAYASMLGVNMDELTVAQPDSGEQALETVEALIDSGAVSIIVVDSVAALVPQAELDGEMGDAVMGAQARLMSQGCRKLGAKAHRAGVKIIFINQIREKIGVMFGNPETTTGGKALKFWASVRLDVRRKSDGANGADIKSANVVVGHRIKIKAVKNKVGPPLRECVLDLIYGVGIDKVADLVKYAKECGALTSSGAWLILNGERIANGFDNTVEALKNDAALLKAVQAEVVKALKAQEEVDAQ